VEWFALKSSQRKGFVAEFCACAGIT